MYTNQEQDEFQDIVAQIQPLAEAYNFEKCATRLDRNGPYHVEDVIAALITSKGSISEAATLLARQRLRLRDYINRNPLVLEFHNDLFEGTLDKIERNYIQAGFTDMGIARHILTTRARGRGWGDVKHVQHTSPDGSMTPKSSVNLTRLSDKELEQLERLTDKARNSEGMGEA